MDGHPAGLHHGRRGKRNFLRDLYCAGGRDGGVFRKDSLAVDPVHLHVLADMALPGEAEITVIAGNMGFAGYMVARLEVVDFFAHFNHLSRELMAENLR
jgi:hypothetical protein